MKRSLLSVFLLLFVAGAQNLYAQAPSILPNILNAGGGTANVGTTIIDFSIGEMTLVNTVYNNAVDNSSSAPDSIVITQGFLQNDLSIPLKVQSVNMVNNLQVFPNPASNIVNIVISSQQTGQLSYRLLDVTGVELLKGNGGVKIGQTKQQINVSSIAIGDYLLEIAFTPVGGDAQLNTFKIQKLQ